MIYSVRSLTAIGGLFLMCAERQALPEHFVYRPALCVVVQGAKQAMLGGQAFDYAEMQSLVISVELPAFGRVPAPRGAPGGTAGLRPGRHRREPLLTAIVCTKSRQANEG